MIKYAKTSEALLACLSESKSFSIMDKNKANLCLVDLQHHVWNIFKKVLR